IPLLANHFLNYYSKKYRKEVLSITPEAMNKLKKYAWPGNVRELQHAIERALIMADSATLQESDFLFSRKGSEPVNDSLNLDEVEKSAVMKAIQLHNGNISKAAEELGLTRASLYRRMEKYGI
ncbi:MAG: helix-turn-helix domain-containing protein, partial [Cytophagales bacterium]